MTVLRDVRRVHWPPCELMPLPVGRCSSHLAHTWRGLWDWRHSGTWLVSGADPHLNGCISPMLHLLSAQHSPSPLGQTRWGNRTGWPAGRFRGVCNRHERWSKMWLQKTERNEWKGEMSVKCECLGICVCLLTLKICLRLCSEGVGKHRIVKWRMNLGVMGLRPPPGGAQAAAMVISWRERAEGEQKGRILKRRLSESESESTSALFVFCCTDFGSTLVFNPDSTSNPHIDIWYVNKARECEVRWTEKQVH